MSEVRVMVLPVWDTITVASQPDQMLGAIKRQALVQARVVEDPTHFELKYLGATLFDETTTLETAGIPAGAPLIALRRRRIPVR